MSILVIVACLLGALVLFTLVKKLIKWMLIFGTMLVLTLIGGYLFLSGDGSMTQEYLPEEVQQEVNTLRNNTNQAIQDKTNETKEKAMNKASQVTEDATNKMKEGIQKAVDESKKSIEKSVQDALSGTEETPEAPTENPEIEPATTEE